MWRCLQLWGQCAILSLLQSQGSIQLFQKIQPRRFSSASAARAGCEQYLTHTFLPLPSLLCCSVLLVRLSWPHSWAYPTSLILALITQSDNQPFDANRKYRTPWSWEGGEALIQLCCEVILQHREEWVQNPLTLVAQVISMWREIPFQESHQKHHSTSYKYINYCVMLKMQCTPTVLCMQEKWKRVFRFMAFLWKIEHPFLIRI